MTKVEKEIRSIEITDAKELIRKAIEEKYGSVTKFLNSEQGKKFGGVKIKPYLYSKGSINFSLMQKLCSHFGIGKFTRKIKVIREVNYFISE